MANNSGTEDAIEGIEFVDYRDESQIDSVMSLVGRDLSEPYSSKCPRKISLVSPLIPLDSLMLYFIVILFFSSLYISLLFASLSGALYTGSRQGQSDGTHCMCGWKDRYGRCYYQWNSCTSKDGVYWNVGCRQGAPSIGHWHESRGTSVETHEGPWMHFRHARNRSVQ